MSNTLVLQSHKKPLPYQWLARCMDSVKCWAQMNQFDYQYIGDDLFDYVPAPLLDKTKHQKVIATDLARLKALQDYITKGFDTVVWCDADFLIFTPEKFILPNELYSIGREIWVQEDKNDSNKLVTFVKVHNAFMMYKKGNSFLDFYTDTAERLLLQNNGRIPPQFIGPKLLTAIHNVVQCPVLETAGMLSPLVVKDIAIGGGAALDLFKQKSPQKILTANLCSSSYESDEVSEEEIEKCIINLYLF